MKAYIITAFAVVAASWFAAGFLHCVKKLARDPVIYNRIMEANRHGWLKRILATRPWDAAVAGAIMLLMMVLAVLSAL